MGNEEIWPCSCSTQTHYWYLLTSKLQRNCWSSQSPTWRACSHISALISHHTTLAVSTSNALRISLKHTLTQTSPLRCLLLLASSSLDILHNSLRTWLKCHFVGDALLPQQSPSIPSSCLICLPTTYHRWSYIICLFIVCLLPWERLPCLLLHFQHSEQCLAL